MKMMSLASRYRSALPLARQITKARCYSTKVCFNDVII
jgi:hypothetical protein